MGLRRVPSFSSRPGFPTGLRVLVIDGDLQARSSAESLLRECSYEVISCSSLLDALPHFEANTTFDVLLAEAKTIGSKASESTHFMKQIKTAPLIIMTERPTQDDILLSIKLGSVDFIEKPLCVQKLKTIWQHTVRKMLNEFNLKEYEPKTPHLDSPGSSRSSIEVICATEADETLPITKRRSVEVNNSPVSNPVTAPTVLDTLSHEYLPAKASSPNLAVVPSCLMLPANSSQEQQVNPICQAPVLPTSPVPTDTMSAAISDNGSGSGRWSVDGTTPIRVETCDDRNRKRKSKEFGSSNSVPLPQTQSLRASLPGKLARTSSESSSMAATIPQPVGLLPGMVWGLPMNPFSRAPGITPPIFMPPAMPQAMPFMSQMMPQAMGAHSMGMFGGLGMNPFGACHPQISVGVNPNIAMPSNNGASMMGAFSGQPGVASVGSACAMPRSSNNSPAPSPVAPTMTPFPLPAMGYVSVSSSEENDPQASLLGKSQLDSFTLEEEVENDLDFDFDLENIGDELCFELDGPDKDLSAPLLSSPHHDFLAGLSSLDEDGKVATPTIGIPDLPDSINQDEEDQLLLSQLLKKSDSIADLLDASLIGQPWENHS